MVIEGVDDLTQSEGQALNQSAIHLSRSGLEVVAQHQAREVGIDQDRTIAVPPVEGQEAGAAGSHGRGFLFQSHMAGVAGTKEARQPGEMIAKA